ncbi:thioredoxin fold domain-containing protein [Psychrobium sp. nBUS_13]|uniref:thioredoxin fold domain-containing protein n=1 Tax=Psychrobium sp. nBUS_13 TaxID=3395319 RepID=UPI003EC043C7
MNLNLMRWFIAICAVISVNVLANERIKLEENFGIKILEMEPSRIADFYRVITDDQQILYMSTDKRFILTGPLFKITNDNQVINVTQEILKEKRLSEFESISKTGILFRSRNERFVVNIFIDTDCFYCKKIHHHIEKYLTNGVSIRYFALPSETHNGRSFRTLSSIWCSNDQKHKINLAMSGIIPTYIECSSPILSHQDFAVRSGFKGTPTLLLEDGQVIEGFISPSKLHKLLN